MLAYCSQEQLVRFKQPCLLYDVFLVTLSGLLCLLAFFVVWIIYALHHMYFFGAKCCPFAQVFVEGFERLSLFIVLCLFTEARFLIRSFGLSCLLDFTLVRPFGLFWH
jgi:hypothetical protein